MFLDDDDDDYDEQSLQSYSEELQVVHSGASTTRHVTFVEATSSITSPTLDSTSPTYTHHAAGGWLALALALCLPIYILHTCPSLAAACRPTPEHSAMLSGSTSGQFCARFSLAMAAQYLWSSQFKHHHHHHHLHRMISSSLPSPKSQTGLHHQSPRRA